MSEKRSATDALDRTRYAKQREILTHAWVVSIHVDAAQRLERAGKPDQAAEARNRSVRARQRLEIALAAPADQGLARPS